MKWVGFILRYLCGTVLLYAAVSKLFDSVAGETGLDRFSGLIASHGLIANDWAPTVAIGVLVVEIIVGVALLLPKPPKGAGWAGVGLLTAFSIYLALVYRHQGNVDCGCLGRVTSGDLGNAIWRNLALTIGAGLWIFVPESSKPARVSSILSPV
jgi:uncharacterized membrane protein YphA (DoxX/SURF4 family)